MKKLLLSLVSLFMLTLFAQAADVKIAYSGSTSNMTGENDAALFGLSVDDWSIVGEKGSASNMPGLNAAGDFRLYYNANGSNTITVTLLKDGATINKISGITFTGTNYSNVTVSVDGNPVEAVDGEYAINGSSFVLGNGNTSNIQVRIKSIVLDVTGVDGNVTHIANTAETAYTVAEAITKIDDPNSLLSETVFIKGIVSQIDNFNAGAIQYWISDDGTTTNQFECYKGKGIDGADFESVDNIKVGATVVVKGTITKYNTTYEFTEGNALVSYEAPAEPVYIQNADFASLEGWTAVTSEQYKDLGNGLIGEYNVRISPATVDETHLATEYCLGFECRWNTNFASYTQTVTNLPAGSYSLVYDVENVNAATTAADYENRFTVTVGETIYTDSFTEWMKGQSAWTTHAIVFTVEEGQQVTISLGYGTGSNNFSADNTPAIYVSHLQLADAAAGEALILENAKAEKLAVLDAFVAGEGLFQYSQEAIELAKRAVNAANTIEEVEAVAMPVQTLPDAEKQYTLQQKASGLYMSLSDGVKLAAEAYPLSWVATDGGWYIKNEDFYVGLAGTNNWTMSTDADKKLVITPAAIDVEGVVYYTLNEVKGMIASDGTEAGSDCYTDKSVAKSGDKAYWTIAEYVAPEEPVTDVVTVTIVDGVNAPYDTYGTRDNSGTPNVFTSNEASGLEGLTLTVPVMDRHSSWWSVYSMVVKPSAAQTDDVLTITAPNGYLISGISANFVSFTNQCLYDVTMPGQEAAEVSTTGDVYTASDLATKSASIVINAKGESVNWLGIKALTVTLVEAPVVNFAVNVAEDIENGAVEADKATAEPGETVTLTITPAEGYELDALTVIGTEVNVDVAEDNSFVMPGCDVTVRATFKAIEESPKNITNNYLVNADLGIKDNGWSYYSDEYKYQGWELGNDTETSAVEFYAGWGALDNTNFKFSQTITLPAGDYRIAVNAFYREGNDGNGTNADKAWIFAGEKKQNVMAMNAMSDLSGWSGSNDMHKAMAAFKDGAFENAFDFSLAEEKEIELGFQGCFDAMRSWCILGPVKLYQYSLEDYLVDYRAKVAEVQALQGKMGATEAQALQAAIKDESEFTLGSQVAEAIANIEVALTAAKASINNYQALGELLAEGVDYKNHSEDAEAKTAYDEAVSAVATAYEEATVADFIAAMATVSDALPALAKTQTADNSDLTILTKDLAWTCAQGNGPGGYAGCTETYTDGSYTAGKVMYQQVDGLKNGLYKVEFIAVANHARGASAFGENIAQVYANETTEDIEVIDQDHCTPTDYVRTLTAVVKDGVLEYGLQNVADGGNWYVAKVNALTLVKLLDETGIAYENALASIADGETYRVFTEVNETKYYLNATGFLVDNADDAATFTFEKVNASGTLYETGLNLGVKFTNPTLTNGSTGDIVNGGHILNGDNDRNDWERQVFFLNSEGKYAVRSTNANSANWGANTYWDVLEGAVLPEAGYSLNPSYVWQIEGFADNSELLALVERLQNQVNATETYEAAEGLATTVTEELNGIKNAQYLTNADVDAAKTKVMQAAQTFFAGITPKSDIDVTFWYIVNPTPLNIKGWEGTAFGTASDGVCEYWSVSPAGFHQTVSLPAGNFKLTAIALTRTGMLGTIYAGENSVNIATVSNGVVNSRSQAAAWFNEGNGVNEVFFTQAEAGDVEIGLKVDETSGDHWTVWKSFKLELITEAPFDVTYNLVYGDQILDTKTVTQLTGDAVRVPAAFEELTRGLFALTPDVETVAKETAEVNVTATWAGPFEISESFETATWYNVKIRGNYYVAMDETEPYYPKADKALDAKESQWAFTGDPFNLVVWNRAAGATMSLTPADVLEGEGTRHAAVLRDGAYAWEVFANGNGFVLRETGTENNWVNQAGGANGPLGFWVSTAGKTDGGSTFVVEAAPEPLDPNDYTSYIVNADLSDAASTAWNLEGTKGYHNVGGVVTCGNDANFDFSQTITLPAGQYKMTAQAAYRYSGSEADEYAAIAEGKDTKFAKLYATVGENTTWSLVQNRWDGASDVDYASGDGSVTVNEKFVPNSTAAMKAWFTAGQYVNEVVFNVFEEGEVTIGIVKPSGIEDGDYTTIGAWTLYRLGDAQEEPQEGVIELSVNRIVDLGYGVTDVTYDEAAILSALGIESWDAIETMYPMVMTTGEAGTDYDGWRNVAGDPAQWNGDGTDLGLCLKYPHDGSFALCTHPGNDPVEGTELTAAWILGANEKTVVVKVNVKFIAKPVLNITFADLTKVDEKTVEVHSELGKCYEGLSATVDMAAIFTTLGVESLSDLAVYAVQSDDTLDDMYDLGTTDGWRNAAGDFQGWGENAYFCMKADFSAAENQIYYIGGMDGKNTAEEWENPASYTATYAFVKNDDAHTAVVLKVVLTYDVPTGIAGIADMQNATIYDLQGRKVQKAQRGGIYIINGKKVAVK